MPWTYLLDHTIGPVRLRVAATGDGFVVTKVCPTVEGQSLRITRHRFAANDREAIGQHVLTEALAAGEAEAERLRTGAQQAIRRAYAARSTMRPGCVAIRRLEQEGVTETQSYLTRGQCLAHACGALEGMLDHAGFPTGERKMPTWIARLFEVNAAEAVEDS